MPININASNYINSQTGTNSQGVSSSINLQASDGAVVSAKGLDLQSGQTISGQVVEIDGKDIKLLLSNNQTINAKLEGNISAMLGQVLSFEVKGSENGQTALRPLYTNLNTSQTVSNALNSAGLPVTENYVKMVSSMMDEGMPINKNALSDMSKNVNSFPNANPETVVRLNKLGLSINELTINQYENYKGFEHQIKGNVDTIAKGLSDLIKDSLTDTVKENGLLDIAETKNTFGNSGIEEGLAKVLPKNLFSSIINAFSSGNEQNELPKVNNLMSEKINAQNDQESNSLVDEATGPAGGQDTLGAKEIPAAVFDTSRLVLDMINPSDSADTPVSANLKSFALDFVDELKKIDTFVEGSDDNNTEKISDTVHKNGREQILNELKLDNIIQGNESKSGLSDSVLNANYWDRDITGKNILELAKEIATKTVESEGEMNGNMSAKLAKLLSSKEFLGLVKDNISKQMLLKPEEVVNSKNIEELYSKILKETDNALNIMNAAGKANPEVMDAAKNIADNVNFMNELNQVVTYVQLPLLMNNKAAHGDLYVYTKKKSLKDNDGNISALLHLDMENLGPMDIYVQLTNSTKLNTHFYFQDEKTIDFIEAHIDRLNKRLTEKGYDMNMNISVKDKAKGPTNMADEFLKNDPLEEGLSPSKFSFDVRA